MTGQQRKKQLYTNIQIIISVVLLVYIIVGFYIKLLEPM